MPGILMSRIARSGRSSRTSSIASSPRPVSPDDLVALFFEDLLEVEADDRLVLGDHDARGLVAGSVTGSVGVSGPTARPPCGRAAASCSRSSSCDRRAQGVAVAGQRVGVAAGLAGLGVGERRLGDERAQAGVVGLVLEEHELLLGDRELGAEALEPVAHVDEAPLQDRPRHGPQSTVDAPRPAGPRPARLKPDPARGRYAVAGPGGTAPAEADDMNRRRRRWPHRTRRPRDGDDGASRRVG